MSSPEVPEADPAPPAASSGAGTPLILLHAFPLDGRMWAPQVEALAGTYQVIVPDLRGFGAARDQAVSEAGSSSPQPGQVVVGDCMERPKEIPKHAGT